MAEASGLRSGGKAAALRATVGRHLFIITIYAIIEI